MTRRKFLNKLIFLSGSVLGVSRLVHGLDQAIAQPIQIPPPFPPPLPLRRIRTTVWWQTRDGIAHQKTYLLNPESSAPNIPK